VVAVVMDMAANAVEFELWIFRELDDGYQDGCTQLIEEFKFQVYVF
jgi:hypothetical protein